MLLKRGISVCGTMACILFFLLTGTIRAEDTTEQIIKNIDEILSENPPKPGEKAQTIKIAEDGTATILVLRLLEGAEIKSHIHKTHNEIVIFIRGNGQMTIDDKRVEMKPGTIHFNPMGKVHATKNIGAGPLVAVSIFTPAMRETDRHFVQ